MHTHSPFLALRTLAATVAGLLLTSFSWASGQEAELASAINHLNAARGAEAYTAVREIWKQWGTTDPTSVEQALNAAAQSSAQSPAVRSYAAFFAAHARTRRGDRAGAERQLDELGYVRDWLVLGPFDNEGKAGLDVDFGPESQLSEPIVPGRGFDGKERLIRWRQVPRDAFPYGWLDGNTLFRPEQYVCYYATSFVTNAEGARKASLWLGTSGSFKLFVNGTQLLTDTAYRGHDVDRHAVGFEFPSGTSRILVKVCGDARAPVLSLRLADLQGAPEPGLRTQATFAQSEAAVSSFQAGRPLAGVRGPLATFESQTESARSTAAALEAYARYLVETDSDDPTQHLARDLSRRAAELEPTLERLLLAAQLSEDHNQHRRWTERAESHAKRGKEVSISLLLARAQVERAGLNTQGALPHYLHVLRLNPARVEAVQGAVQMYNEAGLTHTALKVLERAVREAPNAVTLLNMYASQLAAMGLEQRAREVERRYARLRADDHSYLADQLELALVKNERATAERWLERLLALNPGSIWARSVAARAYRRLGQPQRAIAEYQRALELAPDDVALLRALGDLHGEQGARDEQLVLLRRILEIQPQAKDVAEYVRHIEPEKPRADEAYAWSPERFLRDRHAPSEGNSRRTLVDLTVTTVYENGLSSKFKQVVFQPLVGSAAALSRQYLFQFHADRQRVQLRGARVFRANGRVDEAVDTGIGAADDPSIAMYTSVRTFYIQLPRLEPGDVVELRYRVDDVTPRNEFADYFGALEYFESNEPIGHVEWVLLTPKRRRLNVDHQGVNQLEQTVANQGDQRIYRFWARDVPAVEPEPAMPPWPEVLGFVHVSTFEDYAALGRWYWGLARDQLELDEQTRQLAHRLAQGLTTEREKVAAVYNWVINNTRYVALEFGIYGYKPRRCVQTVSRGWGDCKDKAAVIVALLRELGIDATLVILRTQMRGAFESKIASLAPFDHAIAYIPSLGLYLDGTAEYTGIEELPAMDQGALGVLVNRGNSKLVTVDVIPPDKNRRVRRLRLRLDAQGHARLSGELMATGSSAPAWRSRYSAEASQRDRVTEDLSRAFPGLQLETGRRGLVVEAQDYERPVVIRIAGHSPNWAREHGGRLSAAVTTATRLTDEFASLSQRRLPVRIPSFGSVEETYEVELPAGHRIVHQPQEVHIKTRFGSFSVEVQTKQNTLTVTSRLAVDVVRVDPGDYAAWRRFCQAADAAFSPRLVLERESSAVNLHHATQP